MTPKAVHFRHGNTLRDAYEQNKMLFSPKKIHFFFLPPPPPAPPSLGQRRAYVHPSADQIKIFVQGRTLIPINGSKLIFHIRMYLLRDQQEYTRAYISRSIDFGLWPDYQG